MTRVDNAHHLQRAAAARHAATVERATRAIEELDSAGQTITFASVALAAGVSRGWLYSNVDIRAAIVGLRRQPATPQTRHLPAAERESVSSLRQRLDAARSEISRLRVDNANLREQLARSLGEQRLRR